MSPKTAKLSVLILGLLLCAACQGVVSEFGAGGGPGEGPVPGVPVVTPSDCQTPRAFFETSVWPLVVNAKCVDCHVEGAPAADSAFSLLTESSEGFLEANFREVRRLAQAKLPDVNNRSPLELKPTNTIAHGGAEVIVNGGQLHSILLDFIGRVDGMPCDTSTLPPLSGPFFEGVTFVAPERLLRRLTLGFGERLPTDEESAAVEAGGLTAVSSILDQLMEGEPFVARVQEGFSDILLTDGYEIRAGDLLSYGYHPNRNWLPDDIDSEIIGQMYRDYDHALRREPIELVGHIVRNDRSIQEIITADYTMVSPYTARGYGVFDDVRSRFENEDDPFEFIEVELPAMVSRDGHTQPTHDGMFPHAGVLTMPQWLERFPTTESNRNRGRTRVFFEQFFAVDLLALAPAVVDTAAETARFENPTMNPEASCYGCHVVMDPVAGLFQEYDEKGDYLLRRSWFDDMFGPGFQDETLPEEDETRKLAWLGALAANDPRFPIAMTEHAYYILTQEKVLVEPSDETDPLYASRRRGYDAQRAAIREAATALTEADFNLKAAIRSLAMSDFFRADNHAGPVTDTRRITELEVLGLSALLTPEQLQRKFRAVFGVEVERLSRFEDLQSPAAFRYPDAYMLFGGVDHASVTERTTDPNGVIGAIVRRLANELSCSLVPSGLFSESNIPYSLTDPSPGNEADVRENLAWLHSWVLGQEHDVASAEINRSYSLYAEVVSSGRGRMAAGAESESLAGACGGESDPDYQIRGWQAVLNYLVRRPEFLLQ